MNKWLIINLLYGFKENAPPYLLGRFLVKRECVL